MLFQSGVSVPWVYVEMKEMVSIVGETLNISCCAIASDHSAVLTWTHSARKVKI